ncbi:hypothetical protein LSTR_LSTR009933 [Laodelphax striatellus]|uniref:Uncharacterized protein n=1 Tax=Laodelphax striatellus TaxID=195883 RepID=A0A482X7S4_LAOST|nr:hypothetical protein LSTR_LSTR009933 [Laodelphax striatellus]
MAILLKARNDFPAPLLNFVNAALPGIWGRLTNVFLTATASELLFDGILINCTSTVLLPRVICVAVEQNAKALVTLAKNVYLFSFFGGVISYIVLILFRLYGTDSSIFPPHRRRDNASFTAYIPELCRVVKGTYVGDTMVNGINGHEYVVSLGKGGEDPISSCYCSKPKKCPPGVVDITPCMGAPLTASFPHFFDAPEFQNDVIGLNPDKAKHATYGILQEASGVPLEARRRIQISIELKKIPYVGVTNKLKGYMCPLVWIEEAFDLEGDLLSMVKYQLVLGLTAMSAVKWGLLILGAGLSVFGGVGKYMNGPNWKKMGRGDSGEPPQNPPNLSKVEEGEKYQKFQNPKTDNQSRSIMFYKGKFSKTDSSIQTEPLFYAVRNGKPLQPQKVVMEDRPSQKHRQEMQTIIPLYSTEVEPDSQSQPIQDYRNNVKPRLDSPGSMDHRFPLLNIVNADEIPGYQGSESKTIDGVEYRSYVSRGIAAETKQGRSNFVESRGNLEEQMLKSRENVVSKAENESQFLQKSRSEMEDDLKLKADIKKLNARLNVLERMKENLSKASEDRGKEKKEVAAKKEVDYSTRMSGRDNNVENNSKLENEAEELGIDRKLFRSENGGFLDEALKTRNLKLEEEARKLRVELNVLKGLKNGQFPPKNTRRDDWVQTDEPVSSNLDNVESNNNSTRGIIKKPSDVGSQPVVISKPSVRFQQKVDLNGIHVGDKIFLENQSGRSEVDDDLGYSLNSREKFFSLAGVVNFDKIEEKDEELEREVGNIGKESVIDSTNGKAGRKVDIIMDNVRDLERVNDSEKYVKNLERGTDFENYGSNIERKMGNRNNDKNLGLGTGLERGKGSETGTNIERGTNVGRGTNMEQGTKFNTITNVVGLMNRNTEKTQSIKPVESDTFNAGGHSKISSKSQSNNAITRIQGDPSLKMTLHESMQISSSRKFENEVLKVLRGDVKSEMKGYGILGGESGGKLTQKTLEPMENSGNFSKNNVSDVKEVNVVQSVGKVGAITVENFPRKIEEFSRMKSLSSEDKSERLRQKYYDQLNTPPSKRRKIQISSSTEDSDQVGTEETTLDEDSNFEELDEKLRKLSPETEREEKDKLPDLKKVKIKKNWKKVLTIVHTSRQIYNYRQLEKRQLFGESVEDYREDHHLEDVEGNEDKIQETRKISRSNSIETDSIEDYDSLSRSVDNISADNTPSISIDNTPSMSRSIENTPSMSRRRPSLKYLDRVESIDSLLDSEGMSDAKITLTGAFSGGILRRRLSRESSLSDDNV